MLIAGKGHFPLCRSHSFFVSSQFDCDSRSNIRNSIESRAKSIRSFLKYHKNDIELHLSQSRNIHQFHFISFFRILRVSSRHQRWQAIPNVCHSFQMLNTEHLNIQHASKYIQIFIISVVHNQRCHIYSMVYLIK